jgi:hypothetical protein
MLDATDLAQQAEQLVEPREILVQRSLSEATHGCADSKGNISLVRTLSNRFDAVAQQSTRGVGPTNTGGIVKVTGEPGVEGMEMCFSVAIGEVDALRSGGAGRLPVFGSRYHTSSSHN